MHGAMCMRNEGKGADAYTQVIVLVHLKAVFIFHAAVHATSGLYISPKSNFLRFSPSFLSEKSEVIYEPPPLSTHTGPCSCFL